MSIRSTATANPVLTDMAVDFVMNTAGFLAQTLFPLFMTAEQSAQYYKFDTENIISIPKDLRRAPGGDYKRWTMKISDDTYACKEFGLEQAVDDRERKKYTNAFNADTSAVRRTINGMLMAREHRVKALAISASVPSSSPTKKWNEADADIFGDIDTVKEVIEKGCGMMPNVIVVSRIVFNVLKDHPSIIDRIKYTSNKSVTPEVLAALFDIDRMIIAGTIHNSAVEGQALNPAYLWGDSVILAHTETAQDLQAPSFGRTFVWTGETGPEGVLVETYRDDARRSDIHRVRHDIDEKLCGPSLGYHLSDVLA